ncbi:MAG: hypothetical protein MUD01_28360, partial [Chloroflexaceae bacterium]|nr:hypothetical protein [Chloroflexaceae bacterium]
SERGRLAFRSLGGWFARLTGEAALTMRGGKKNRPHEGTERPDPATTMPPLSDLPANPAPKPRPLELGESLPELYAAGLRQEQDTARRRPEVTVDGNQVLLPENGAAVDLSDTAGMSARYGPLRPRREVRPTVDLAWYQRLLLPFQQAGDAVMEVARGRQAKKANPLPKTPLVRGNVNANRRQRRIAPWLQLMLLVGLVAALVLYGVNVSQQSAQQRALEFLSQADQRLTEVASAPDEAAALDRLNVARQAIDEVRASPLITNTNPTLWLRYQTLQRNYETALSSLQRLSFFEDVTVVARHPLPDGRFASLVVPAPATSSAEASAESRRFVYALDANRDNPSIYRIPIEGGEAQPYLSPGQTTPAAVVGPLRALAWREGDLVAVDQGTSGYGYYFRSNNEWNYIRLGGSDAWNPRGRLDLKTFAGNLYVWGAQDQEILRYDSGLYGNAPAFWLDPNGVSGRDLSSAVDMAVDGNIYLLQPDGNVLVFQRGQLLTEVVPEAIQPPITAVTRFFTAGSPESGAFFLLDTLNERIIQMDKQSGKVVQQIKVRESDGQRLDQLTDLVIDDNNGQPQIYLVNGGTILRARLPVAPAPFRPGGNANPAPTPAAPPAP